MLYMKLAIDNHLSILFLSQPEPALLTCNRSVLITTSCLTTYFIECVIEQSRVQASVRSVGVVYVLSTYLEEWLLTWTSGRAFSAGNQRSHASAVVTVVTYHPVLPYKFSVHYDAVRWVKCRYLDFTLKWTIESTF